VFAPPPGATQLAIAASGVQAFSVGASVGVQFHPEVTTAIVDGWLADARGAVPNPGTIQRETASVIADARTRAFALFDRIASGW
jgi:GMP synthase-like glutamine amidotransferase